MRNSLNSRNLIGVDASKDWLDADDSDGIDRLVAWVRDINPERIV